MLYGLHHLIVVLALAAASAVSAEEARLSAEVPFWQSHDLAFSIGEEPDAPFQVEFSGRVKGPGGVEFTLPGFYEGKGTWKLRVAPTASAAWEVVTRSSLTELDGRTARLTGIENSDSMQHGGLRINRDHPRHFQYEDGKPFYPLGYECDWLWALDLGKPNLDTTNGFLDLIKSHEFNYIIVNDYACDTGWREGRTGTTTWAAPDPCLGGGQQQAAPRPIQPGLLAALRPHDGGASQARDDRPDAGQGLQQTGEMAQARKR